MDKIFVLAPENVADECAYKAGEWISGPSGIMFSDSKTVSKAAVAEYLANEKGFTLYKSIAKYPKDQS